MSRDGWCFMVASGCTVWMAVLFIWAFCIKYSRKPRKAKLSRVAVGVLYCVASIGTVLVVAGLFGLIATKGG